MEQNANQTNMWNSAGKAGLAIGLLSATCMFLAQWAGQSGIPAFAAALVNGVLWLGKFIGCIYLMWFFMKKYAAGEPGVDNSGTFRFGMATALLSAIIHAAFSFADVAFIYPEEFMEQMNIALEAYTPLLDSNSMNQLNSILDNIPQITFFSNLIYCFLYGIVLSFILSRNIPSKDPFADYKPE